MLNIGIPKEQRAGETRVAATPESVKKLVKKGVTVSIESSAGNAAGFADSDYTAQGATITDTAGAWGADIVMKVHRPTSEESARMKRGALLLSFIEPYNKDGFLERQAGAGINVLGMEIIPRTSRAQSMDALSSQANIAGYRAVLEATTHYGRFFPMMMTSAGSAKPARVTVLGAGVAGLQAIATARRLGAQVEAYDVRPEVKEQILSLGAKFIEIDVGESGAGAGGYAKELSDAAKQKLDQGLTDRLKKSDIIISTANIPGRKAPVLIREEAVRGMRMGSVIIDMAASNGGNCPLSEPDRVVVKHGVTIVGITNFPALVPADSSGFYARNLNTLLFLLLVEKDGNTELVYNLEDDIIAASLAVYQGAVRYGVKSASGSTQGSK